MPPRLTFLINCFDNSTLFVKCSAVRICGTHLAHTRFIFRSFPKIWCAVVLEIPHLSATSRTVSRRSPLITSRTSFFTASDSLNDGLPSRSSSAKLSLPSANLLCHLNINERLTLLCFSDCFKNLCVSVGIFPMSTQNFITARCSTFSANVPFFSNADPVFSASNPYFSAISKRWLFKFSRCNVKSIVDVIV